MTLYRCDVCGRVAAPRTKCNRLVVETRPVSYPYRPHVYRAWRGGKWVDVPDPGGDGDQIVREVCACPDCAATAGPRLAARPARAVVPPEDRDEISYDLIFETDNYFMEGTYRVRGGPWQVFIMNRHDGEIVSQRAVWDSGVEGFTIKVPESQVIDRAMIERILGELAGVASWRVVRGPDSIVLR